ncbi:MAG: hypothetical protein ACR2JC_16455 [Chloroflexota bacterium]|nr:MAG: hypothetical protein DLM70_10195 [Chloroflexota bacterium]
MTIPTDKKDQGIYHMILADMHRVRALLLNMQTIDAPDTELALREHFSRDQNLTLGKLTEWKTRKPSLYREAMEDFQGQVRKD